MTKVPQYERQIGVRRTRSTSSCSSYDSGKDKCINECPLEGLSLGFLLKLVRDFASSNSGNDVSFPSLVQSFVQAHLGIRLIPKSDTNNNEDKHIGLGTRKVLLVDYIRNLDLDLGVGVADYFVVYSPRQNFAEVLSSVYHKLWVLLKEKERRNSSSGNNSKNKENKEERLSIEEQLNRICIYFSSVSAHVRFTQRFKQTDMELVEHTEESVDSEKHKSKNFQVMGPNEHIDQKNANDDIHLPGELSDRSDSYCEENENGKGEFTVSIEQISDLEFMESISGRLKRCSNCILVCDAKPALSYDVDFNGTGFNQPLILNELYAFWVLSRVPSKKLQVCSTSQFNCLNPTETMKKAKYFSPSEELVKFLCPSLCGFVQTETLDDFYTNNDIERDILIQCVYKHSGHLKNLKGLVNAHLLGWIVREFVAGIQELMCLIKDDVEGESIFKFEDYASALIGFASFLSDFLRTQDSVETRRQYHTMIVSLYKKTIGLLEFSEEELKSAGVAALSVLMLRNILSFAYSKYLISMNLLDEALVETESAIENGEALMKLADVSTKDWNKYGLLLGRTYLLMAQICISKRMMEKALIPLEEAISRYREQWETLKSTPTADTNDDWKHHVDGFVKALILLSRFKGKIDEDQSITCLFEACEVIQENSSYFKSGFIRREASRLARLCLRLKEYQKAVRWYKVSLEHYGYCYTVPRSFSAESADVSSVSAVSRNSTAVEIEHEYLNSSSRDVSTRLCVDLGKIGSGKDLELADDFIGLGEALLAVYEMDASSSSDSRRLEERSQSERNRLEEIVQSRRAALQLHVNIYGDCHSTVIEDIRFLTRVEILRGNTEHANLLASKCRLLELRPVLEAFRAVGGPLYSLRKYHLGEGKEKLRELMTRLPMENNYDEVADCLRHIGHLNLGLGQKRDAVRYYIEAVRLRRRFKNPATVMKRNQFLEIKELISLMWELNMLKEAKPYHEEAVDIARDLYRIHPTQPEDNESREYFYGENTIHVIKALNDFGSVRFKLQEFDQARELFEEASKLGKCYVNSKPKSGSSEEEIDSVMVFTLQVLKNLATLYTVKGEAESALDLYTDISYLSAELYTFEHEETVHCLVDLAQAQTILSDQISQKLTLAETGEDSVQNDNDASILKNEHNLAYLHDKKKRLLSDAQRNCMEAIDILKNLHGSKHQLVAAQLSNLANILVKKGELQQAEKVMIKALEIDRSLFGPMHPEVNKDKKFLYTLSRSGVGIEHEQEEDDEDEDDDEIYDMDSIIHEGDTDDIVYMEDADNAEPDTSDHWRPEVETQSKISSDIRKQRLFQSVKFEPMDRNNREVYQVTKKQTGESEEQLCCSWLFR